MPRTARTPSIVPVGADQTAYLVIDCGFRFIPVGYSDVKPATSGPTSKPPSLISCQGNSTTRPASFALLRCPRIGTLIYRNDKLWRFFKKY